MVEFDETLKNLTHPNIKEMIDECKSGSIICFRQDGDKNYYLRFFNNEFFIDIFDNLDNSINIQKVTEEDLYNL